MDVTRVDDSENAGVTRWTREAVRRDGQFDSLETASEMPRAWTKILEQLSGFFSFRFKILFQILGKFLIFKFPLMQEATQSIPLELENSFPTVRISFRFFNWLSSFFPPSLPWFTSDFVFDLKLKHTRS